MRLAAEYTIQQTIVRVKINNCKRERNSTNRILQPCSAVHVIFKLHRNQFDCSGNCLSREMVREIADIFWLLKNLQLPRTQVCAAFAQIKSHVLRHLTFLLDNEKSRGEAEIHKDYPLGLPDDFFSLAPACGCYLLAFGVPDFWLWRVTLPNCRHCRQGLCRNQLSIADGSICLRGASSAGVSSLIPAAQWHPIAYAEPLQRHFG